MSLQCMSIPGSVQFFFYMARQPYMGLGLLVSSRFHGHTHLRHTTVDRTPLDEWPARRRDLYLTTHNTNKRETSMPPPVGFEPTILVSERPKTHTLDRTVTGIGGSVQLHTLNPAVPTNWQKFLCVNILFNRRSAHVDAMPSRQILPHYVTWHLTR
jgi:hypothetical protein